MNKKNVLLFFLLTTLVLPLSYFTGCREKSEGPYFATGIKIGEVTDKEAIVWVRLTQDSLPAGPEQPMPEVRYIDPDTGKEVEEFTESQHKYKPVVSFPRGYDISMIEGATIGLAGDIMIYYKPVESNKWDETKWYSVDQERDFTVQVSLDGLKPDTPYELRVISRYSGSRAIGESITGTFKTAPPPHQQAGVLFTVTTGQAYPDQDAPEGGFRIYNAMLALNPDFFVHTGDILYYDELAKNIDLARWHWSRTYSLLTNLRFHKKIPAYFMKDDHDTWVNDCWPGMKSGFMGDFTFEQGQRIFLEQVPMRHKTYRTYRWGKDLQVWLMEGRDYRSPNTMPDGPGKTIWGKEQIKWLKYTTDSSSATFKLLITPTPVVGPDRENKHDNYSNENFTWEGSQVREWISSIDNMYVITGDRHWQYISVDEQTGIREYSCGPASDQHAGGWSNDRVLPEHLYLNVTGGFLTAEVFHEDPSRPRLIMSHYDVDGAILNSDTLRVYPPDTR